MPSTETIDLNVVAQALTGEFPAIVRLFLFGSRRFRTRSLRSDIDLLLEVDGFVKSSDVRDFALQHFPIVDPFILEGRRATSCMNDSYIEGDSIAQIVANLRGVEFWRRDGGLIAGADIDVEQKVARGVKMVASSLPDLFIGERETAREFMQRVEGRGMPTKPFIGEDALEVAEFLVGLLRNLIPTRAKHMRELGKRAATPGSEYDFQDLFWVAVKPWLPGLAREEVAVKYDGQEKSADFSYAGGQIVVEMKHVKDTNTKANVVKTLGGLADFYRQHSNVRVIIFAILVDSTVPVDAARWESDFSYGTTTPRVITVVIPNKR